VEDGVGAPLGLSVERLAGIKTKIGLQADRFDESVCLPTPKTIRRDSERGLFGRSAHAVDEGWQLRIAKSSISVIAPAKLDLGD